MTIEAIDLLGDSIYDNQSYVEQGDAVIDQISAISPVHVALHAVDGQARMDHEINLDEQKVDVTWVKSEDNSTSQRERFLHMYEAEKILMDELPIIPIYTYTRIFMKHESVEGWNPNLLDSHAYQYISIEDK